jgi:large subunit ribosomal protein L30
MAEKKKIKVKLVRSTNGCLTGHVATVRGLGLRRLNHVVELADTPEVRGMIERVSYLVRLES